MEINSRALNKNELFCCTQKEVKKLFGEHDIYVSFAYFHRHYQEDSFNKRPKVKGKIIAAMQINNRLGGIGIEAGNGNALLMFYVLINEEFSKELHDEFVLDILPKMHLGYLLHKDGNSKKISGIYNFIVELLDGKLFIYEGITN